MTCDFYVFLFFFFKQKTAYEMRISDWSSDVCSSDLHLSLNRRLQPAVRQGQFLHSSQTSAGHRRRKIGRYSFAIVGSSQAFHGYQKRPAYEPHGICDRFPSSTPARHSPHPAGLSARRLPTLRAWPALASWMLCPQSRSAVAIGPIAASDTDTALLLRRLRPYLLPVARLPRAPALVRQIGRAHV